MQLTKILKGFRPALTYDDAQDLLSFSLETKILSNSELYEGIETLTQKAVPSIQDEFDTSWSNFYLPLKRRRIMSLPFWINKYKNSFSLGFQGVGIIKVEEGKEEIDSDYYVMVQDAITFIPYIKETKGKIIERTVPYDIRTGKIKGKYILDKVMTKEEKEKYLQAYKTHQEKNLKVESISLDDYLQTAALCYQAFDKKRRTPLELYKKHADGRDGGMLDLDPENKEAFMQWYSKRDWQGSHPFEIVFSLFENGICLYPPTPWYDRFTYSITEVDHKIFLDMVTLLIENEIPFKADGLEDVLEYFTGETDFTVNEPSRHSFYYKPGKEHKKEYFHNIKWNPLNFLKWKTF